MNTELLYSRGVSFVNRSVRGPYLREHERKDYAPFHSIKKRVVSIWSAPYSETKDRIHLAREANEFDRTKILHR